MKLLVICFISLAFSGLAIGDGNDPMDDGPTFRMLTCVSSHPNSDAVITISNLNTARKFLVSVSQTKPTSYHNFYEATASFSGDFWNFNGQASDGTYFHLLNDDGGDGNVEAGYKNSQMLDKGPINIEPSSGNNITCYELN